MPPKAPSVSSTPIAGSELASAHAPRLRLCLLYDTTSCLGDTMKINCARWIPPFLMLALAITAVASRNAFGQAGKAELSGRIVDPSHLAVPGAEVQLEDAATSAKFSTQADERGDYHLLGLPAGEFVLTVEQRGFRTYRQSGITLRIADHTQVDVTLELGEEAQSIDVNAQAPLLQAVTGEVSNNVDQTK